MSRLAVPGLHVAWKIDWGDVWLARVNFIDIFPLVIYLEKEEKEKK